MNNPRVVVIIPARYASHRLPGKPLLEIAGEPMIRHVVERAQQATGVHAVIVATDDARIADVVRAFGGRAVMTPETLRSGSDRVAHVAASLTDAEIVVNVQGDEPLFVPAMIDEAIAPLLHDRSVYCGTLARTLQDVRDLHSSGIVKVVMDRNHDALYFSRSPVPCSRDGQPEDWPRLHTYYKHIGLYAFRREFLLHYAALPQTPLEMTEQLEQLRILEHGYRLRVTITQHDSIPVDTPEDLELVRSLFTQLS